MILGIIQFLFLVVYLGKHITSQIFLLNIIRLVQFKIIQCSFEKYPLQAILI